MDNAPILFCHASGDFIRIVVQQNLDAMAALLDSPEEQLVLEGLLEQSKPQVPYEMDRSGFHYLFYAPFRYPPLKHGSRFGSKFSTSLFYASLSVETALAESAYYQLFFYHDMATPPSTPIKVNHKLWRGRYSSDRAVDLQKVDIEPSRYQQILSADRYETSQQFGDQLRQQQTELLLVPSVRDGNLCGGYNLVVFKPEGFGGCRQPISQQEWQSQCYGEQVEYFNLRLQLLVRFELADFCLADGSFPSPAN